MEAPTRNPLLWQKAKARAKFQAGLVAYVLVNAGLWALWALTPHPREIGPWPAWVSLFWGVGLVVRGIAAYGGLGYEQRAQREYERLLRAEQEEAVGRVA